MKKSAIFVSFMLIVCGLRLNAAPVDLSAPPNSLGAANAHGYVQFWREIDEVDFGNDLKLPLRLRFSSEPQKESTSPPIGVGFWCPLTSAAAYLKREKMLRCELICGKVMYLRRDKKDFSKFYSLDKKWTGIIDKDKITISRGDGWELRYQGGFLRQLKTDSGRLINWIYNGSLVTEIREEGSANSPLKLAIGPGGFSNGFYVNGKLHSFELGKRPRVEEVAGQRVVAGFDPSLAVWKWPEGKQESFQFEVNEKLQPNLKFTDREGAVAAYVWDGVTSKIVSADEGNGPWDYTVGTMANEIDLPKLERTNAKGESEFLYVDKQKGLTERKSLRKGHTITEVFLSAGPLYGKVRKVEKIVDGEKFPVFQAGYDETGRLLRKVDEKGFLTLFKYSASGDVTKERHPPSEKSLLENLYKKENELKRQIEQAASATGKSAALQRLGYFYISEMGAPEKAHSLLPLIKNVNQVFNIKFHLINENQNLSDSEKIAQYEALLAEFPSKRELLDLVISNLQRESASKVRAL